ncbi:MAG: hypothetical protein C5B50_01920 [Verrucomicrobia bacterium]|nr:MAG: hypothetical protein C5B50_01920 [Verrucomicrobiota bacterium]
MRPKNDSLIGMLGLLLALAAGARAQSFTLPERLGVVDVIPNSMSGETNENSEPSLGVGSGTNFGKLVLHTFEPFWTNDFFASSDSGVHWALVQKVKSSDVTLDWSPSGTAYAALLPYPVYQSVGLWKSSDPTAGVPFSFFNSLPGQNLDQPWVVVVSPFGADQIYIGLNGDNFPRTATVHFYVGTNWHTTTIEQATPFIEDGPPVRIAVSADGKRVYAAFVRFQGDTNQDEVSDVVLVRDDNRGLNGFNDLPINGNGGNDGVHDTQVARGIVFPISGGTSLGSERLGSSCSIGLDPGNVDNVYVAYTEVVNDAPLIRLQASTNGGKTFQLVYSTIAASALPALAVAQGGTVGLLFAALTNGNMEVHFLRADNGNFNKTTDRVLASFPDNDPNLQYNPYLGDYFQLKSVGEDFFGAFCASGDPQPSHFPCGVWYQRNVKISGVIHSNFSLSVTGALADLSGNFVAPSIDPFFFYDLAPVFINIPILEWVPFFWLDPSDPLIGIDHFRWAVLPPGYPQFRLQGRLQFGAGAGWSDATDLPVQQVNGMFYAPMGTGHSQRYFRLIQDAASGQFSLFASAGANGYIEPSGIVVKSGLQSQTFTATPGYGFAIGNWYLDGVLAQSGLSTLTVSNITAEHIVTATFVASNDLAAVANTPSLPLIVGTNFSYSIHVQNIGLNPLTLVTLTDALPASVTFVSATSSQGSVGNSTTSPNLVTGNLGGLAPGQSATVTITVTPNSAGTISNIVNVACAQTEPNLANNTAIAVRSVIAPVSITSQPASQSVPVGGTATFSVGVSGSPPFDYQWYFNSGLLAGSTAASLTLTNVTAAQAGSYNVMVRQMTGPDDVDVFSTNSATATLTVGP